VLLVTSGGRALLTIGGVAASVGALALFGIVPAGMLSLATLWFATSGPSVIGGPAVTLNVDDVDPSEVRQYRAANPGTTIIEAVAVIGRR
jgi:hypothetical protein